MPIRCFVLICLLSIAFVGSVWSATPAKYIPAPEIALNPPDPKGIQREIDRLTRRIKYERPTSARDIYKWMATTGNNIGALGDYVTASWAAAGQSLPKALDDALEKFGIVFAVTICLEKQFVSGQPAGLDAAYETAKFLTGKIAGGGVCRGRWCIEIFPGYVRKLCESPD